MDISVLVPVYNSAQTLHELIHRTMEVLDRLGGQYEIVLVDDGSADRSWVSSSRSSQTDW